MKKIFPILCFLLPVIACAKIYKGAEYRTKVSYTYGKFEVRMKSAQRDGVVSSFFTYNDNYPTTPWNEIDIEILGRYTDDVQFNPITPGQVNHEAHFQTPFNPAADFHTYGFEWTPTSVAWFVDGTEVHRQTGAHIQSLTYPQKIMMNIWNPDYPSWVGSWNPNALPAFAYYDWVQYSSYTPGAGNTGTGNNFSFQWKDDFNSLDTSRWAKASHTWNGNLCDMLPDNIVFQDSRMILCLTTDAQTGYSDLTPPSIVYARAEAERILIHFTEEVNEASVKTLSNYTIPNMTVSSAAILPDSQSVALTVVQYDTAAITNIVLWNIKDRFSPPNTMSPKNVTLIKAHPLHFPVKINCGGSSYNDYLNDTLWNGSVEYGRLDGSAFQNSALVTGVTDPTVYRSGVNNPVKYFFRVPNGSYTVELQMVESYFTTAASRIFSIAVQGVVVEKNLDLCARVGKNAAYQTTVQNVRVTDGILNIHFMATVNYPLINGITIAPTPSHIKESADPIPKSWNVGQNYPNPFNGRTVIPIDLPQNDHIVVKIFDTLGKSISEIALGDVSAGHHAVPWNTRDKKGNAIASGIYYYVVTGRSHSDVKKLMLLQ